MVNDWKIMYRNKVVHTVVKFCRYVSNWWVTAGGRYC